LYGALHRLRQVVLRELARLNRVEGVELLALTLRELVDRQFGLRVVQHDQVLRLAGLRGLTKPVDGLLALSRQIHVLLGELDVRLHALVEERQVRGGAAQQCVEVQDVLVRV
jgi:hypothetical protein